MGLVGFDFANIFANTIYYYLFNDVVPEAYLSRFMSIFRMTGIASGMVYSRWIMPHAMDHFRTIFVLAGIVIVLAWSFRHG